MDKPRSYNWRVLMLFLFAFGVWAAGFHLIFS